MIFPPTDWGDFTEDEYEVGAPATSNHFERWFRNIVAAFQGALGAPRLQLAALERLEPGTQIRVRRDASTTAATIFTVGFIQFGTVRFATSAVITGTGTPRLYIVRKRAQVSTTIYTFPSTGGSPVDMTTDISVIPGDVLSLIIQGTTASATNSRIQTNGQDLWPGPTDGIVEGNKAAP